jgi:hypothetical protein
MSHPSTTELINGIRSQSIIRKQKKIRLGQEKEQPGRNDPESLCSRLHVPFRLFWSCCLLILLHLLQEQSTNKINVRQDQGFQNIIESES